MSNVRHATDILCDTGYRRNSLSRRERLDTALADRGNDKRRRRKKKRKEKKRKEEGCNAGCWGKGKISAWVSRERLRDRGDGRLNIGFSDARGTYLMSYIFRWAAHSNFHSPTVERGREKKKKKKESYILFSS